MGDDTVNPERILIIRLSSIGDIVLTSPLLRIIKSSFPGATIDFAVKKQYTALIAENPHIDTLLPLDTADGMAGLRTLKKKIRATHYDLILDVHRNIRSFYLRCAAGADKTLIYRKMRWPRFLLIHTGWNVYKEHLPVYRRYLRCLAGYGMHDDGVGLELYLDPIAQHRVDTRLKQHGFPGIGLNVAIAPGAGFATKRWLPERFAELADRVAEEYNATLLLLGDAGDRAIAAEVVAAAQHPIVNAAGWFSLAESAAALNRCDALICNDTGLMHMACALDKKVVAVFGPTTEELGFFPVGNHCRVVQYSLDCRPCTHIGSKKCPKGHFKCMNLIETKTVMKELKHLID